MKKPWILFLIIPCLLLQGCMSENPYINTTSATTTETTEAPTVNDTPSIPYRSPRAQQLLAYLTTDDPHYLKIISKTQNEFGSDRYTPANLVVLDATCVPAGKEIQLDRHTSFALYAMLAEMAYDGITGVMVTSGYRSYDKQMTLFNSYLHREMQSFTADAYECLGGAYIEAKYDVTVDTGLDMTDADRVVRSYAATPGNSEHQTGLCVDFITPGMSELTNAFEGTQACSWLKQNAYRFGFILRYPKDKTETTGYAYESWHYRYVGRDAATEIYSRGLTLEEYRAEQDAR